MRSLHRESEGELKHFAELYIHYGDVPSEKWRWPNFTPKELACPRTGQLYVDSYSLDCLQLARNISGVAFHINSAHRSRIHNVRVRGAPRSRHLLMAFDISLRNHDVAELYRILIQAGFGSFGIYNSFIHADVRKGRRWFSSHKTKREFYAALNHVDSVLA